MQSGILYSFKLAMGFLLVCADINVGISDPDLTVMLQVQLQVMVGRNATIEHNKTAHAQRIPKKKQVVISQGARCEPK